MLAELHIRGFAIIDEARIAFRPGLTALSGETGAGKSIVRRSLEFVLGIRSTADIARDAERELAVEALFDLSGDAAGLRGAIAAVLGEEPGSAGPSELLVTRSITSSGRSRSLVNGRLATADMVAALGKLLVTIGGQGEHLSLLDPRTHLELIDSVGGLEALRAEAARRFGAWRECARRLESLERSVSGLAARETELREAVRELSEAKVAPGRRAALEAEVRTLSNTEAILSRGEALLEALSSGEGPANQLRALSAALSELARLDPGLEEPNRLAHGVLAEIEEIERLVSKRLRGLELDGGRLEALREELAETARLQRKYRTDDDGLAELLLRSAGELELLADPAAGLDELRRETAGAEAAARSSAAELSAARQQAGESFGSAVERELKALGISRPRFAARFTSCEPGPTGSDRVELLLSANAGHEPQELRRVASGGELSRVLLALKRVIGARSGTPIMVFDEIDTGVSGRVARAVGEKLWEIARDCQVICITHLPQVASLADSHFKVEKRDGKRARVTVSELFAEHRVTEIAAMLAGYEITDATLESARQLIASKS